MNKLVLFIVVLVLIIGGFLIFKNKTMAPSDIETEGIETEVGSSMPAQDSNVEETQVMEENMSSSSVKEFSITGVPFSFTPSTMTVNKGDTVKITFKNGNGVHDFKLDEFNASTRILNSGEEQTITFVASKTGSFEYYCSVGNHRAMGMVGTLTVR
jgi:plastocyanin